MMSDLTNITREPLTPKQKSMLALLLRSPDEGDGWRQCSPLVWPLVQSTIPADLIEKDYANLRVRLSEQGVTVARFMP